MKFNMMPGDNVIKKRKEGCYQEKKGRVLSRKERKGIEYSSNLFKCLKFFP